MVKVARSILPEVYGTRKRVSWDPDAEMVHYLGPKGEAIILTVYTEGLYEPSVYYWPLNRDGYPEAGEPEETYTFTGKSRLDVALRPAQRKARKLTGLPPYR